MKTARFISVEYDTPMGVFTGHFLYTEDNIEQGAHTMELERVYFERVLVTEAMLPYAIAILTELAYDEVEDD